MIAKVVYGGAIEKAAQNESEDHVQVVSQIIDCARLYPTENSTHWGFNAYDANDSLIAGHVFEHSDSTKVYVMESGKTVDVLPRR